jgi:hypothetical protein
MMPSGFRTVQVGDDFVLGLSSSPARLTLALYRRDAARTQGKDKISTNPKEDGAAAT